MGEETNVEMQESVIEGPGAAKRVDVVIVNWNSNSLLRECIAALDQSTIAAALRVIIVDNVVRNGAVIDENCSDPAVLGVRRLNDQLAQNDGVDATTIQTVGSKGYDGFTLAVVS